MRVPESLTAETTSVDVEKSVGNNEFGLSTGWMSNRLDGRIENRNTYDDKDKKKV